MPRRSGPVRCSACGSETEPGVLRDSTGIGATAAAQTWLPSAKKGKRSILTAPIVGLDTRSELMVKAYRCKDCGRVELFAVEE